MLQLIEEMRSFATTNNIPIIKQNALNILLNCIENYMPLSILEIGTAIGYSAINILNKAPDNCLLTTIEINEELFNESKKNFIKAGYKNNVISYLGDCCEIIKYLEKKFHFIFLDGPKGQYSDMLFYLDKLLYNGGIIFADNISFKGMAEGLDYPEHKHRTIVNSLRKFKQDIKVKYNYNVHELNVDDGILIGQKTN